MCRPMQSAHRVTARTCAHVLQLEAVYRIHYEALLLLRQRLHQERLSGMLVRCPGSVPGQSLRARGQDDTAGGAWQTAKACISGASGRVIDMVPDALCTSRGWPGALIMCRVLCRSSPSLREWGQESVQRWCSWGWQPRPRPVPPCLVVPCWRAPTHRVDASGPGSQGGCLGQAAEWFPTGSPGDVGQRPRACLASGGTAVDHLGSLRSCAINAPAC